MLLQGKLYAESPIYRGNARKTLFTRDGDGTQRLVSLAGEIAGTAQSLMDAFLGQSKNGKNFGLLNRLWLRLYGAPMPDSLISRVECALQEKSYSRDHFFDLRMGIKLDEDRWAAEANANYKFETVFRNSVFDISIYVTDNLLKQGDNATRLYHVLNELKSGRFWFGAGKSRGLGRCRLEMDLPFAPSAQVPRVSPHANHLSIKLNFNTENPVLVGWNWGRVDPNIPAFAAVEGRLLVESMRTIPAEIRQRLAMSIGGPILTPANWKKKLAEFLPRVIAIWLRERANREIEGYVIPFGAVAKMGKGKHPLSQKIIDSIQPIADKTFASKEEATEALNNALGKKSNMANRILEVVTRTKQTGQKFDEAAWREVATSMGWKPEILQEKLAENISDEKRLTELLSPACIAILPQLHQQVDRQIRLLQSDAWIEAELSTREEHLRIKTMLLKGEITQQQWRDVNAAPSGIKPATWREFLEAHSRVEFNHMLNTRNLNKSITNDRNHIAFLKAYRERARQELAQPQHTDFRAGGASNREISRKYGKPYDKMFMRMLCWSSSNQQLGWEVYIPGSTIKGAFRRRASQVLKTLWGEGGKTADCLDRLFGKMGQRGLIHFADAHLADPKTPEHVWCTMDGVRMDSRTAQPVEEAKADYLYAYGRDLVFNVQLDLQDLHEGDLEAMTVFKHLLADFEKGDIPLGGEKSNGFGWVQAHVAEMNWLTTNANDIGKKLFGNPTLAPEGIWQTLRLAGEQTAVAFQSLAPLLPANKTAAPQIIKAQQGFVSHRAFGGYCGKLELLGEVLTPISVQESGQPTFSINLAEGPVNGWDFFSLAPAEAEKRGANKIYALPAKSLRGAIRHIYGIAGGAKQESTDLSKLNASDSLFGFVGNGPNQALMSRVVFGFAKFESPELAWFKFPYPYGSWQFVDGKWQHVPKGRALMHHVDEQWRLFPHAPLAPNVERVPEFKPDTVQATYMHAILPGARCRFSLRFWNLEEQELKRLLWSLVLEPNLGHKMGKGRYVGFGSLRFSLQPESYLIDWSQRYAGKSEAEWRKPIAPQDWLDPKVIVNYEELRRLLNAEAVKN